MRTIEEEMAMGSLTKEWEHFTLDEFKCKHCGENKMDPHFIDKLEALRLRSGIPLKVTSGYRCPEYNKKVSHTGLTGPHTTGHAADLAVSRHQAFAVLESAFKLGGFTGIGVNQKGEGRFLHLDDLEEPEHAPRPTVWSY